MQHTYSDRAETMAISPIRISSERTTLISGRFKFTYNSIFLITCKTKQSHVCFIGFYFFPSFRFANSTNVT